MSSAIIAGLFLIAWGLWCLVRAPRLAVCSQRLLSRALTLTPARRREWLTPLEWRVYGVFWCLLGSMFLALAITSEGG